MKRPSCGDEKTRRDVARLPEHSGGGEGSKLERVRAFVAGHDGNPLTPELLEEATDRPTLEEIRAFRESLNVPPLTEEFLERAINEGRV